MNAEEKFLIDVALFALIIAIWVRWRRSVTGSNRTMTAPTSRGVGGMGCEIGAWLSGARVAPIL
jgi:hypothetical protein